MKRTIVILILCLALALVLPVQAQPKPGDVFREYVWLPTMVKESVKFLRVGGRLDYKHAEEHMPRHFHHDGHLPIEDAFDLVHAIRAEMTLELVQSHEDTKGLALQINGHEWIDVPNLHSLPQPQSEYMLHTYPTVPIPLAHLKEGSGNTFKLKVDTTQRWNWPQNIFYGFIFRIYYDPAQKMDHRVAINGIQSGKRLREEQSLFLSGKGLSGIRRVDYIGRYEDFNWEGDGQYLQWHYHTHKGELHNHIGGADKPPFQVEWNTSWLPDQSEPVQITARIEQADGLIYLTETVPDLHLKRRYSVELCRPYEIPKNWVTRAGIFSAHFDVQGPLEKAQAFQVAWRSWSPCYARGIFINDHQIFDRQDPCYDYAEHLLTFENTNILHNGKNTITTGKTPLIDGKMVHGMEIQYPGVMVKVKYRTKNR